MSRGFNLTSTQVYVLNELSSLDIAVITAELDMILKDSRINNIYQLNEKTLLLKLRKPGGLRENLLIEAGTELHTTAYVFKMPLKPPDFCMALRKYLRNGRIKKIQQHDFERIVELTVETKAGEYRLVIELFGDGNIILVDPENKILHALTYRRMKDRNIIRGEIFKYPPPRGKDPRTLRREDLEEIRKMGQIEVVRSIARILGIGGKYAEELLIRAGIEKNKPSSSLKDDELDSIYESLQELLSEVSVENETPCIFVDEEDRWIDVAPIEMKKYSDLKSVRFERFNQALDEFYIKSFAKEKTSEVEGTIGQQIARLERILKDQERTIQKSRRQAETYRRVGEAIYLHLNELQFLMQRVMSEKRSGKSWKEIVESLMQEKEESRTPAKYFVDINPKTMMLQVSIEDLAFDLDLKISAQKNAAQYYERAKKAERRARGAEEALKQTLNKIEEAKRRRLEKAERMLELPPKMRKREWYEKFRWFHSSDGFLAIGGRDKAQNELLIKRYMEPKDLVFHAEIVGAPFVLLKTQGKQPSENTIYEAAQFAGSYSRAWKEGLGSVNVYWVKPDQLSKSPPSGEYLSKGAFMIYGPRNYVRNVPLEIAIGVVKKDGQIQVIGGPPTAVAKQTGVYVKIVPGNESSGQLAKRIRRILARMLPDEEDRRNFQKMPLEEVQRFIPSGRGAISKD